MTALSPLETAVQAALATVTDPLTGQDWVATRRVKSLKVEGGTATIEIELGYPARSQWPAYTELVRQALAGVDGVHQVDVRWRTHVLTHAASRGQALLPGPVLQHLQHLPLVRSGKEGPRIQEERHHLASRSASHPERLGKSEARQTVQPGYLRGITLVQHPLQHRDGLCVAALL